MKRAIITGATGAIGTALVRKLIAENTEVLVLARRDSERIRNIPESPLVTIKYCALDEMHTFSNASGINYDVLFHLAWAGTTGAARNDVHLQHRNIGYALDAVDLAERFGCHTFIGAGSQAEYGRVDGVLTPDTPVYPENGYGMAKLAAGELTRLAAAQKGMRHIWVRILSVYGPYDSPGSMVSSTIEVLRKGITPEFTPGEQQWDYLYSDDAANALVSLAERGADGRVYVLGSGRARPLKEYIEMIRDVTAPGAFLAIGALPYGDKQVMHLQADISALEADTGWQPETDFCQGIRQIIQRL